MLYFVRNTEGTLVSVQAESPARGTAYQTRNDFTTKDEVDVLALEATKLTGDVHLGVDQGPGHYPRFDVVRAPKVGDLASYGFNGDSYACGEIVRVSKSLSKITTRTEGGHERDFYRRGQTSSWKNQGTWGLIRGHHDKRNPSF